MNINERTDAYLLAWYTTSVAKKSGKGAQIELTYEQFRQMLGRKRYNQIRDAIHRCYINTFMDENNPAAYVLTWRSYAACSTKIYNVQTATICTRAESKILNRARKGDVLRPEHVAKLSKALTGRTLTDEHRQNISDGKKGKPGRKWTPEQLAKRAETRLLNKQKKSAQDK